LFEGRLAITNKIETSLGEAEIIILAMVGNVSTGGGHGPGDTLVRSCRGFLAQVLENESERVGVGAICTQVNMILA
jgi:hypothetical protein